jgi:hypothetical protein
MDGHQIFRKLLQYCRGHRLNSVDHLVCHLVRHLVLHLVHLHLRNHHRHRLDEVRQSYLDDLHLDEVRQNHLDDRRLDDLVRLDVVRQSHLDDRRLDDLVRLDERQLDVVLQIRRRLDVVRHFPK